jgi:hypothetical protein
MKEPQKDYTDREIERRRDEVIRRMANTPPQPKAKIPVRPKKKKKAGAGLAVRKGRCRRED